MYRYEPIMGAGASPLIVFMKKRGLVENRVIWDRWGQRMCIEILWVKEITCTVAELDKLRSKYPDLGIRIIANPRRR